MKEFLIKYRSKINLMFTILEILLIIMIAGMDKGYNNPYLYLLLTITIGHYGLDLLAESRFTNRQRIARLIIAIGGVIVVTVALNQIM